MSIVTIFQHRILLIFIPPLLVFCSLSKPCLHSEYPPTHTLTHSHPLSFPFLSFPLLYPRSPWGLLFFFQIHLSALPPFMCPCREENEKKEGGGVGERGMCALIYFIRVLVAQKLLNSTSLDVRGLCRLYPVE